MGCSSERLSNQLRIDEDLFLRNKLSGLDKGELRFLAVERVFIQLPRKSRQFPKHENKEN